MWVVNNTDVDIQNWGYERDIGKQIVFLLSKFIATAMLLVPHVGLKI